MTKTRSLSQLSILFAACFGLGIGAASVGAGTLGSPVYLDSTTGLTHPAQVTACYMSMLDGSTVDTCTGAPPTTVGQALRVTSMSTSPPTVGFVDDPTDSRLANANPGDVLTGNTASRTATSTNTASHSLTSTGTLTETSTGTGTVTQTQTHTTSTTDTASTTGTQTATSTLTQSITSTETATATATAEDFATGETAPFGIALDTAKVYWSSYSGGQIRQRAPSGGTISNFVTGETNPMGVAVDHFGGRVYWAAGSSIRYADIGGDGTAHNFQTGESVPQGVAYDAGTGTVYWANNSSGAIRRKDKYGGTVENFATGEYYPGGVTSDGTSIYWTTGHASIRVKAIVSGTAADFATGEADCFDVSTDGTYVYWTSYTSSKIRRKAISGGSAEDFATGETGAPFGINAANSTYVYWVEYSTGIVRRKAKSPSVITQTATTTSTSTLTQTYTHTTTETISQSSTQTATATQTQTGTVTGTQTQTSSASNTATGTSTATGTNFGWAPPAASAGLILYFSTTVLHYLVQYASATNAENVATLTATPTQIFGSSPYTSSFTNLYGYLPGMPTWPRATYELSLWLRSTADATVTVTEGTIGSFPPIDVPGDDVRRLYTVYLQTSSDIVATTETPYSLTFIASAPSGSASLHMGRSGAWPSRFVPHVALFATMNDYRFINDRIASGFRNFDGGYVDATGLSPPTTNQCLCATSPTQAGWMNVSTATGASISIDTSVALDVTAGTALAGTQGKASDSGHQHHIGSNTPTQGQMPVAANGTDTSTSTGTASEIRWVAIPSVSVSTSLPTNITAGPASAGSSTSPSASNHIHHIGANTPTQGQWLVAGTDTTTSTSTTNGLMWATLPIPSVSVSTSLPTNITAGPASAGSSTSPSASNHIHHIGANTPTHGQWLVAGTDTTTSTSTTNGLMWATLPVPPKQMQYIYYGDNYNTVTSVTAGWVDVLSTPTSGGAGKVVVAATMTVYANYVTGFCAARLTYDGVELGAELLATPGTGYASLAPLGETSMAAGYHTIALQIGSQNGTTCSTGAPGLTRAVLTFTEYTN